mgnify:CR=1 FL=1
MMFLIMVPSSIARYIACLTLTSDIGFFLSREQRRILTAVQVQVDLTETLLLDHADTLSCVQTVNISCRYVNSKINIASQHGSGSGCFICNRTETYILNSRNFAPVIFVCCQVDMVFLNLLYEFVTAGTDYIVSNLLFCANFCNFLFLIHTAGQRQTALKGLVFQS